MVPTPRMGGILLYFIVIVSLFSYTNDLNQARFIIIGSVYVAIAGIIDDIKTLTWKVKFALQSLSVIHILYLFSGKFDELVLLGVLVPFPLNYVLLFFFILGAINSINLMDGMDGLVSGFSMLVFGLLIILSYPTNNQVLLIISTALFGALLGFLKFNASPAKIFLGDTGSLTLGYFLVLSTLLFSVDITPGMMRLSFPLFLLAVPIIDTLKVMFMRIIKKNNPFLPDKNHLHHLILGSNVGEKATVFIILSFSVGFLAISMTYLRYSRFWGNAMFIVWALVLLSMKLILRRTSLLATLKKLYLAVIDYSNITSAISRSTFIFISTVLTIGVLISFLPSLTVLDKNTIGVVLVLVLILFAISYVNYKKTKQKRDVYVFINLVTFFLIGYFSNSLTGMKFLHREIFDNIIIVGMVSLTALVILFVMSRSYHLPKDQTLFTGLDLILIVLILLLMVFNQIMGFGDYAYIGMNGFYAMVIYIWYKIITSLGFKYNQVLYYLSFVLPILSLCLAYLNK